MRFRAMVVPPLLEVVVYTPAETVLAPYIERAPSPETKTWFATNFKNWLLKAAPENLFKLPYLPPNATPQQEKAFSFKDLYDIRLTPSTETMIEHLLDYFQVKPNPPRLERMSVPDVIKMADDEINAYNKRVAKQGQADDPKGVKTLMEFPGGYRMVELSTQPALDREGNIMGHCVGSLHGCYIKDKSRRIFSLRDGQNQPHATLEVHSDRLATTEIKGRRNAPPIRRYWPMIRQFIDEYKLVVANDYRNIGLLQIEDPDSGETLSLTTDQFRDMMLDPNDERGQKFGAATTSTRYMDTDMALGLFNALYGTDRLSDAIVMHVFSNTADHAIQVIEHYGNRLTPHQLVLAFSWMRAGHQQDIGGMYKAMLIATKPDAATVNQIIESISVESDRLGRRYSDRSEDFVVAVSQVMPEVYREIISDPEAMQRELDANNARASGPFFALSGTGQLTPEMIQRAFHFLPKDALKRLRRDKIMPDQVQFEEIIRGASTRYWGRDDDDNVGKFLDALLEYVKPDQVMMSAAFAQFTEREDKLYSGTQEFAANLLLAAKRQVPDSIDKNVAEQAVIAIDKEAMFQDFLKDEPNPSERIQQTMWRKASAKDEYHTKWLQYLRKIDQPIWQGIFSKLTPEPIPTTKDDYKYVKDKKTNQSRQVKIQRGLKDEEKAEARQRSRREAIGRFLRLLDPAIQEPGFDSNAPIALDSPKYLQGKAAFEALGKGKLFDDAVKRLNRQHLITRIKPESGWGGRHGDRQMFMQHIDDLTAGDIVHIIDGAGYDKSWFGALVDAAPYRVPEVVGYADRGYGNRSYGHYGKFDYPVDKEKALASLEAVWASKRVPEGVKDDYTLKVMKRFKPKPPDLLRMLQAADSYDATRYILKKTKRPTAPLLRFIYEGWPDLLTEVGIEFIPDDLLVDVMRDDWKVARQLMDRDLRGYGKLTQRKWETPQYRAEIGHQKESDVYARYAKAAEAAGKATQFARYVREAELEDLHPQLVSNARNGEERVNMALLQQHLDEYSIRTLIHVENADTTGEVAKLYFDHFSPKKLVVLVSKGAVHRDNWYYREHPLKIIKKLDPQKLRATVLLGLQTEGANVSGLIQDMIKEGFKFDDELTMAVLQSKDTHGYSSDAKKSLIHRTTSPTVLHWIADNKPHDIDDIRHPDAYVISKLFDNFGKLQRGYEGKVRVNYWFNEAVMKWFNSEGVFFKYKPNPEVAKMLKAEAMRRGGVAVTITRAMFQYLEHLRKKSETDSYVSTSGGAHVRMVPRGAKIEKE